MGYYLRNVGFLFLYIAATAASGATGATKAQVSSTTRTTNRAVLAETGTGTRCYPSWLAAIGRCPTPNTKTRSSLALEDSQQIGGSAGAGTMLADSKQHIGGSAGAGTVLIADSKQQICG